MARHADRRVHCEPQVNLTSLPESPELPISTRSRSKVLELLSPKKDATKQSARSLRAARSASTGHLRVETDREPLSPQPRRSGLDKLVSPDRQRKLARALSSTGLLSRLGEVVAASPSGKSTPKLFEADSTAKKPNGNFSVGTQVRPLEVDGPWRDMGDGKVAGVAAKRGFVNVKFKDLSGRDDIYPIRASSLIKVADIPEAKLDSDLARHGIVVGDAVIWQKQARGVVADYGPTSATALVKFGGVGIKSVRVDELRKVALNGLQEGMESLTKAEQARAKEVAALKWAKVNGCKAVEIDDSLSGLKVDDCVVGTASPWNMHGLGVIKKIAEDRTAIVRFNILGETWTVHCDHLQKVAEPDACKFKYHVRTDIESSSKRAASSGEQYLGWEQFHGTVANPVSRTIPSTHGASRRGSASPSASRRATTSPSASRRATSSPCHSRMPTHSPRAHFAN